MRVVPVFIVACGVAVTLAEAFLTPERQHHEPCHIHSSQKSRRSSDEPQNLRPGIGQPLCYERAVLNLILAEEA